MYQLFSKNLDRKVRKDYEAIINLMTPMENFRAYRRAFKEATGPRVPCLGNCSLHLMLYKGYERLEVHLKDLLYATEGGENWLYETQGVVNLGKLDIIGKIISVIIDSHAEYDIQAVYVGLLRRPVRPYTFPKNAALLKVLRSLSALPRQVIDDEMEALLGNAASPPAEVLEQSDLSSDQSVPDDSSSTLVPVSAITCDFGRALFDMKICCLCYRRS